MMTKEEARHRARQIMRDSIEAEVQGRQWNRGSPARLITHDGRTLILMQWAECVLSGRMARIRSAL